MTEQDINELFPDQEALAKHLAQYPEAVQASVACSLIGHSRIVEGCFGYMYCARCGDQVHDALTQGPNPAILIIGHDCDVCRELNEKMTWKDRFLVNKDPLTGEELK